MMFLCSTPNLHLQAFNLSNPLSPRKSFFRVQINVHKNSILIVLIRAPQTVRLHFGALNISKTGARYALKKNHPLVQP
jgi:hypothetical protein